MNNILLFFRLSKNLIHQNLYRSLVINSEGKSIPVNHYKTDFNHLLTDKAEYNRINSNMCQSVSVLRKIK